MEILETGVVTIRPQRMDLSKKGSFRATRDIMRVGHAASAGDPKAFEAMLDVIIANSEIEVAEGAKGDMREMLLDELSMNEAKELIAYIGGRGAVSPTNGGPSVAG